MATLTSLFEQFLRERRYLKNVSPKTIEWCETAWKGFLATQPSGLALNVKRPDVLTRQHLNAFVVGLRDRGVRPVTVNTWLRAINAYCRWLHEEGVVGERLSLRPLRLEKRFVKTLDEAALRALISFRPKGYPQWRVHTAACTILDTGCRINEVLTARVCDFDFDNLLLTVIGNGDKQRIVPMSFELRRQLIPFAQLKERHEVPGERMFPARNGGVWHQRNALRSYYLVLGKLGLPRSGFHRRRHTAATEYLKHGGDVVRLSRSSGRRR